MSFELVCTPSQLGVFVFLCCNNGPVEDDKRQPTLMTLAVHVEVQ